MYESYEAEAAFITGHDNLFEKCLILFLHLIYLIILNRILELFYCLL